MNFLGAVGRLKTSHKDIQILADQLFNCRILIYLYLYYSQDDFIILRVVFVVLSVEEYYMFGRQEGQTSYGLVLWYSKQKRRYQPQNLQEWNSAMNW